MTTTTVYFLYKFTYTQDDCDYQGIPNTVERIVTNAREAIDAGVEPSYISVESRRGDGY